MGEYLSEIHNRLDEYSWEVENGVEEDIRQMGERAIEEAGKHLKLALPLEGEGKASFEGSWRDVH